MAGFSESEEKGISLLSDSDKLIYSVGISTGGVAEIRMAKMDRDRKIVATTIDEKGISFALERILKEGLSGQIEVKNEDVSKPLPYPDNNFDFIYARLVLHYLSKQDLERALNELNRILKVGGKIFVVVRSNKCVDAMRDGVRFDAETSLTHCDTGEYHYSRYFHSEESIETATKKAHFETLSISNYDEQLYIDFERQKISDHVDNVIELVARKI